MVFVDVVVVVFLFCLESSSSVVVNADEKHDRQHQQDQCILNSGHCLHSTWGFSLSSNTKFSEAFMCEGKNRIV